MAEFNGKLLGGINSKVQLYQWTKPRAADGAGYALTRECGHHGHILALYIATRGDYILVGDLMKSMSLLMYKPGAAEIEEVAKDFDANWMTAVAAMDADTYIGAENNFNVFTVRYNADATTEEEKNRLDGAAPSPRPPPPSCRCASTPAALCCAHRRLLPASRCRSASTALLAAAGGG